MSNNLKPCPFCGTEPRRTVKGQILSVECPMCVSVGFHNHARFGCLADSQWNERFVPSEPEPQWRSFKAGEMPERYRDYWYRVKGSTVQVRPMAYNANPDQQLRFANDLTWIANVDLFITHEVQIDGVWQPVGVLE